MAESVFDKPKATEKLKESIKNNPVFQGFHRVAKKAGSCIFGSR